MTTKLFRVDNLRDLIFGEDVQCERYILEAIQEQDCGESRWFNRRELVFSETDTDTKACVLWRTPSYNVGKTENQENEIFEKWEYTTGEVPCTEVVKVEKTTVKVAYEAK
jgi:hypothetical protein